MDSQYPPEIVVACAVQLNAPAPVLRTSKIWGGVTPPPGTATNVTPPCERAMICGLGETVMVIGMVTDWKFVPKISNEAEVVPIGRLAGLAVMLTVAGELGCVVPCWMEELSPALAAPERST